MATSAIKKMPLPHARQALAMARRALHSFRISLLACLVPALFSMACNEPQVTLPIEESVQTYRGTWEYRYGDSPHLPDGSLAFAQPGHNDGKWLPTKTPWTPPPWEKQGVLWLRTQLTGPELSDPMLYSRVVDFLYEVYLDGKLVNHLGKIPPERHPTIGGPVPLFQRLPKDYIGRWLSIRVYSQYRTVGLMTPVYLSGRTELIVYIMQKDLTKPLVGFVVFAVSVVGLVTYFIRRREIAFLYFFGFTVSTGIFVTISRNPVRYLFSPQAHIWWIVELISMCSLGMFLCGLFQSVFGPGPLRLNQRLKLVFLIFMIVSFFIIVFGIAPALALLYHLQILFLLTIIYAAIYCFVIAIMGNVDARTFAIGFFLAMIPVIYDLLSSLRILPGSIDSPPLSALTVVITLIILLSRRFLALNKRLINLSALLQLNLASVSQLDDKQQAQTALEQLIQLLPISRAHLFLSQPSETELRWVDGRNREGTSESGPTVADRALAKTVAARGRTLTARARSDAETAPAPTSPRIVGMPMRTQGQMVGVLCVELRPGLDGLSGDDGEALAWLCNQLALSLMTSRALRLEVTSTLDRRRLAEQAELLRAAARMAGGDLKSPVLPSADSELSSLSQALETMRRDLQVKFQTLEEYNREINALNDELRRQIDQRSRRVLDLALNLEKQGATKKAHYTPGAQLGEHYQVTRLLGQGTMGSVYEVLRTTDGRQLAAKVLAPRADKLTMIRFAREAQLLARLKHPSLISITDVDVTQSGILFLVMELIKGTTLKLCQDRYGDLSFVLPVIHQIAQGLAAIHAAGIVHRDLKPANVLISEAEVKDAVPVVKLVDFGISTLSSSPEGASEPASEGATKANIARITEEHSIIKAAKAPAASGARTRPSDVGLVIGTPAYMAPESGERQRSAQPSVDIWSFGVIAFELITRELPFEHPPVMSMAVGEPIHVESLAERRPDLAPTVTRIIQSCLVVEPEKRPSAEALVAVLAAAVAG